MSAPFSDKILGISNFKSEVKHPLLASYIHSASLTFSNFTDTDKLLAVAAP